MVIVPCPERKDKMFKIDDIIFKTSNDVAEYIVENMDADQYDDMLDEIYGEVQIAGYTYSTSNALKNVDRIAYECGFDDMKDLERSDIVYELNRMDDGDSGVFQGMSVECMITKTLTSNRMSIGVDFTDLEEAKEYYRSLSVLGHFEAELMDAEDLDALCDVLNENMGDGSGTTFEIIES